MRPMLLAMAVFLASSCASLDAKPAYMTGSWGGEHAAISFQGAIADVSFDCASGSIDALIFPTKEGAFEAKGTYRNGPPGPVKVGQIFVTQPAVYSGNVTKDVLTLTVELEDGTQVGPFTLTQGAPAQLNRCR